MNEAQLLRQRCARQASVARGTIALLMAVGAAAANAAPVAYVWASAYPTLGMGAPQVVTDSSADASAVAVTAFAQNQPAPGYAIRSTSHAGAEATWISASFDIFGTAPGAFPGSSGGQTTSIARWSDQLRVLNAQTGTPIPAGVLHGRLLLEGGYSMLQMETVHGVAGGSGSMRASFNGRLVASSSFRAQEPDPFHVSYDNNLGIWQIDYALPFTQGRANYAIELMVFGGASGYPTRDFVTESFGEFVFQNDGIYDLELPLASLAGAEGASFSFLPASTEPAWRLVSDSGYDYTQRARGTGQPVPEPAPLVLLACAVGLLRCLRARQGANPHRDSLPLS